MRTADKGGSVVVFNGTLYKKLNITILQDTTIYKSLSKDHIKLFLKKLKNLLENVIRMCVIDQKLEDKLYTPCLTIPAFHSLPKLHKGQFLPSMRPIVPE